MTSKPVLDGDRDQLGEYLRDIADMVGLRDWYFTLSSDEPEDRSHGAECDKVYGQKVATISFRNDWPTWSVEDVRRLMVHELIHCHTWAMDQRVCDLRGSVGSVAYDLFNLAFRDALEHTVDGIARAWAETLPLPIKREKKRKKAA